MSSLKTKAKEILLLLEYMNELEVIAHGAET